MSGDFVFGDLAGATVEVERQRFRAEFGLGQDEANHLLLLVGGEFLERTRLSEYRSSRHPDRFYNLKIGIPWADLERRLDVQTVLSQCRTGEPPKGFAVLGVDTGKSNHAVIMTTSAYSRFPAHIIHLEVCNAFEDLDRLMKQFQVHKCVIDGMPETHATRDFARKHRGRVYLNFFNENQRESANWDASDLKVLINRTQALDASRETIRRFDRIDDGTGPPARRAIQRCSISDLAAAVMKRKKGEPGDYFTQNLGIALTNDKRFKRAGRGMYGLR